MQGARKSAAVASRHDRALGLHQQGHPLPQSASSSAITIRMAAPLAARSAHRGLVRARAPSSASTRRRIPAARAVLLVGAAAAVVADSRSAGIRAGEGNVRGGRFGVLGDVGQRLGDDEVRGRLDRGRAAGHVGGDGRSPGRRGQRVRARASLRSASTGGKILRTTPRSPSDSSRRPASVQNVAGGGSRSRAAAADRAARSTATSRA